MTEPSRSRDEAPAVLELRRQARDQALGGKFKKAALLYERLLEKTTGDAQSALRLAELRRRLGDHVGARAAYQLAISLYLEAGWDAKALAVEAALERLADAPAIRPSRLRLFWALIATMILVALRVTASIGTYTWRRITPLIRTET